MSSNEIFDRNIYNENYFNGNDSFFYRGGYGNNMLFDIYYDFIFKEISEYCKDIKNGKVLDVGCAYGFMLERFPESWQKFGMDVSYYAINKARKRLSSAMLSVGNAERDLHFPQNYFDIILLNDIVEHLKDPEKALKSAYRILKKGGIMYITTPNLNSVRKKVLHSADKKEHHVSMFPHKELMALLKKIGFKIERDWTYINLGFHLLKFKSNLGIESGFICKK